MKFKKGAEIQWSWMGNTITGVVLGVFTEPVIREIKGKKIKRNGTSENPAYLVKSVSGNEALKLGSELQMLNRQKLKSRPKIFG